VFDTIGNESSSILGSKSVGPEKGILCTVRPGKTFCEDVEKHVKVTDVLVFTAFGTELSLGEHIKIPVGLISRYYYQCKLKGPNMLTWL
jgi:hypothetical protein